AVHDDAVHEAVTDIGEFDEAALPHGFVRERVGIEASGEFALVAESDANAARHGDAVAAEDAALERAEIGQIPAAVFPTRFVLISPVPFAAAVEARERGQQHRHARLLAEILGLTRVEIVEPIAIDGILPARPVLGMEPL